MALNPMTQIEEKVCLGHGAFGVVYQARWRHQDAAVKVLTAHTLTEKAQEEFMNEVQLMVTMRIPQVVALYGMTLSPRYQLVMEFCSNGSLYTYLHSPQPMDWGFRGRIALDIAQGLAFLHACTPIILHRDLKSHNILLDSNRRAKIADFGLSRVKQESRSSTSQQQDSVGTVGWMAPELFKRRAKYVAGSDMYSFGMILWELSTRSLPWEDAHSNQAIIKWVCEGEREDIPPTTPVPIASLIKQCWEPEPSARPSAAQVLRTLEQSLGQLVGLGTSDASSASEQDTAAHTGASATTNASSVSSYTSGYQGTSSQSSQSYGYMGGSHAFFSKTTSSNVSGYGVTPPEQTPPPPTSGYQGPSLSE